MSKFIAAAPPAPKGEQPAMNNQTTNSNPREDEYGEDPFTLTQNCDYIPPSKVSERSPLEMSLELGFGAGPPANSRRPDLASAPAQTLGYCF